MNTNLYTNLFNNPIIFPHYLNNDLSCILSNSFINNEKKDNKFNLINNNLQINPLSQFTFINSINNFPIFVNNNNLSNHNQIIKPFDNQKQDLKGFNSNFNILKTFNSNLPSPSTSGSLFNDNSFNNFSNNLQTNMFNDHYISSAFKLNNDIKFDKDFLSLKKFPIFYNSNNKNKIIINEDEITFSSESMENSKNQFSKKNMFKLETNFTKKKRGRISINKYNKRSKRIHGAADFDNILRKIQVHFLTFIVQFINEILEVFFHNEKYRFLNIDYNSKKTVNHSYVEHLKNSRIKDILTLPPSPKYKVKFNENSNKKIYEKICEINPFLQNFLEIKYLEFFNKYYIKDSKNFCFDGIEICFKKTKFFCDLLEANKSSIEKMKEVANIQFKEKNSTVFVVNKG